MTARPEQKYPDKIFIAPTLRIATTIAAILGFSEDEWKIASYTSPLTGLRARKIIVWMPYGNRHDLSEENVTRIKMRLLPGYENEIHFLG